MDAPSAEVARAMVKREWDLYGLGGHEIGDTGIGVASVERPGATGPDFVFDAETHGTAEALLSEYGGQ